MIGRNKYGLDWTDHHWRNVGADGSWISVPVAAVQGSLAREKALEYVYLMEETYGGGTGAVKFEKAVSLLKSWVVALGWKLDVTAIMNAITAAVGTLHAEQGKIPDAISAEITEE